MQMDSCVAFCSCKSGCSAYNYWMVTIPLYGICAHTFNPVKFEARLPCASPYRFRYALQDQTQTAALVLPPLPLTASCCVPRLPQEVAKCTITSTVPSYWTLDPPNVVCVNIIWPYTPVAVMHRTLFRSSSTAPPEGLS